MAVRRFHWHDVVKWVIEQMNQPGAETQEIDMIRL